MAVNLEALPSGAWHLHKFGGTSMSLLENVADIVQRTVRENPGARSGAVVSAMHGVTNSLYEALDRAKRGEEKYEEFFANIIKKHKDTAATVLSASSAASFTDIISRDAEQLRTIVESTKFSRLCPVEQSNLFVGYGELWSSWLLTLLLTDRGVPNVARLDAREIVILQRQQPTALDSIPKIDWPRSNQKIAEWSSGHPHVEVLVITGFVCQTHDGIFSILGRNGSDFSATIFANLLNALRVTIWKDVEGVYTADPRIVPDYQKVECMSYEEAMEVSNFGGQVMHPLTMVPIVEKTIPVVIRSSLSPDSKGTIITASSLQCQRQHGKHVKCFSNIDGVAVIKLQAPSMDMYWMEALVSVLTRNKIAAIQIGKSPFDQAVRLTVYKKDVEHAMETLDKFRKTTEHETSLEVISPCSIVAAIGDGIVADASTSSKFFAALEHASVGVHLIAQASTERSISVVVDQPLAKRAIQALHATFLQPLKTVSVGILGPGTIADELVYELKAQAKFLRETRGVNLLVRALASLDQSSTPLSPSGRHAFQQFTFGCNAQSKVNMLLTPHGLNGGPANSPQRLNQQPHRSGVTGLSPPSLKGDTFSLQQQPNGHTGTPRQNGADLTNGNGHSSHSPARVQADGKLSQELKLGSPAVPNTEDGHFDVAMGRRCMAPLLSDLTQDGQVTTLEAFARHIREGHSLHNVIVDCTHSQIGNMYTEWLQQGLDVISTNQHALCMPGVLSKVREIETDQPSKCLYDVAIHAGFNVVSSVRDLLLAGDRVLQVEAVLSVTMAYCFNLISPVWPEPGQKRLKFSEAVENTVKLRFIEADIRDDFSGEYFARKVYVLANECGLDIKFSDVQVESLVPAEVDFDKRSKVTSDEFISALRKYDAVYEKRIKDCEAKGEVLRYTAAFNVRDRTASLGLRSYPRSHPLVTGRYHDMLVLLTTQQFRDRPLMMIGPGETNEKSAKSVLGEIVRLASLVGHGR